MTDLTTQCRSQITLRKPSIALVLGGGGARGIAHILMLEAFDELGLRPDIIAGTSIGAIYGAAYAAGLSAKFIRAHTEEVLGQRFDLLRQLFTARAAPVQQILSVLQLRSALLNAEALLDLMLPSRVPRTVAELPTKLTVVATDYHAHEQAVMSEGPLRSAVAASMALPALFTPIQREGRVLIDGGLVNPLPFDCVEGADLTIAIDVSALPRSEDDRSLPSARDALIASWQISQRALIVEKLKTRQPDIYIDVGVDRFHVLQFHDFKAILAEAEPAKAKLVAQLKRILGAETVEALSGRSAERLAAPSSKPAIEPPRR